MAQPVNNLPWHLRCHIWLAARLLPLRAKRRPIEALLIDATPPAAFEPYRGVGAETIVEAVRATLARPWRMRGRRCLREGLIAFRFLRLAGHPAVLHFAVASRSPEDRLRAHCWVTLGSAAIMNGPQEGMVSLMRWDGEPRFADGDA
jgi:hypothetical protein